MKRAVDAALVMDTVCMPGRKYLFALGAVWGRAGWAAVVCVVVGLGWGGWYLRLKDELTRLRSGRAGSARAAPALRGRGGSPGSSGASASGGLAGQPVRAWAAEPLGRRDAANDLETTKVLILQTRGVQ